MTFIRLGEDKARSQMERCVNTGWGKCKGVVSQRGPHGANTMQRAPGQRGGENKKGKAVIGWDGEQMYALSLGAGGGRGVGGGRGYWRLHKRSQWSCRAHIQLFVPLGKAYLSLRNETVHKIQVVSREIY